MRKLITGILTGLAVAMFVFAAVADAQDGDKRGKKGQGQPGEAGSRGQGRDGQREGAGKSRLSQASLKVGSPLPDVTVYDSKGKELKITSLKGKYTVLVFGCLT